MAIHAFLKAYNTGMGIPNAAELSADVGVCSKSVYNWATEFLEATQKCQIDEDFIPGPQVQCEGVPYKNNFTLVKVNRHAELIAA